jgi:DNA (cytosine-5)-methyltransferase 1
LIRRPDFAWDLADLANIPRNGIKVFSTFSCGGGSTMGYKLAGCDVIGANDIDSEMAWHYKVNLSPKHYFLCPIRDLLVKGLPEEFFGIDILDGSPPCSTFSMAGSREDAWGKEKHFREGQSKQVLSDLFFDFLDLAERLRPNVVIAENVKGMILGNAKGYTKLVMARFGEIGYRPQLFLLNAADCGVPQRRERVFFCAIREDIKASALQLNPKHRWISAREAVKDFRDEFAPWKMVTASNQRHTLAGRTKPWDWDSPSPTIVAAGNNELISDSGRFGSWSFMECKRLGSFPDDYQAKSDKIGKYMVGMSVPPRMMEVVARAVCSQWLGARYASA